MRVHELSRSNYIKKEDVEPPVLVTIARVVEEPIRNTRTNKDEDRWVMYFEELEKGLILNVANGRLLHGITGSDDSDDWIGQKVVLWNNPEVNNPQDASNPGGVRVRAPKKNQPQPPPTRQAPVPEVSDDDIPF